MIDERIHKTDKINLKGCIIEFRWDGIVHIDYKKTDELLVKDVMEIIDNLKEYGAGNKYPTLITVKQFMFVDKDVRELWASDIRSRHSLADAMVVRPIALKMIANFYISVNKPPIPTRVFNDEDLAIEWLKTF